MFESHINLMSCLFHDLENSLLGPAMVFQNKLGLLVLLGPPESLLQCFAEPVRN